jgi:two-component system response regulator HydG
MPSSARAAGEPDSRPETLQEAEKTLILQTLNDTGGNKSEAARRLGITRKTLQNKLHKYGDEPPDND